MWCSYKPFLAFFILRLVSLYGLDSWLLAFRMAPRLPPPRVVDLAVSLEKGGKQHAENKVNCRCVHPPERVCADLVILLSLLHLMFMEVVDATKSVPWAVRTKAHFRRTVEHSTSSLSLSFAPLDNTLTAEVSYCPPPSPPPLYNLDTVDGALAHAAEGTPTGGTTMKAMVAGILVSIPMPAEAFLAWDKRASPSRNHDVTAATTAVPREPRHRPANPAGATVCVTREGRERSPVDARHTHSGRDFVEVSGLTRRPHGPRTDEKQQGQRVDDGGGDTTGRGIRGDGGGSGDRRTPAFVGNNKVDAAVRVVNDAAGGGGTAKATSTLSSTRAAGRVARRCVDSPRVDGGPALSARRGSECDAARRVEDGRAAAVAAAARIEWRGLRRDTVAALVRQLGRYFSARFVVYSSHSRGKTNMLPESITCWAFASISFERTANTEERVFTVSVRNLFYATYMLSSRPPPNASMDAHAQGDRGTRQAKAQGEILSVPPLNMWYC